jgi:hypothetical protein
MVDYSSLSLGLFVGLTLGYFVMLMIIGEKSKVWLQPVYYITVIGSQLLMAYYISNQACGSPQVGEIFIWGLIPWFFVFVGLTFVLKIFPGWKAPFSNTFGYLAVKFMGIREVFNNMIKSNYNTKNTALNKVMEEIYEDQSLLINKFTPENFDFTLNKLKPIFNSASKTFSENRLKLYQLVSIKDNVSEMIWYMLAGVLTSSMSSMGLLSSNCAKSVKQIEAEVKAYHDELGQQKKVDAEKAKTQKTYYIRD